MPQTGSQSTPWSDRFTEPDAERLIGALEPELAEIVRIIRQRLTGSGLSESLGWHGLGWGWSLAYRSHPGDERARAYLIVRPQSPVLAMPVPLDVLGKDTLDGCSRAVREGIASARVVEHTAWCEWAAKTPGLIDEVLALLEPG